MNDRQIIEADSERKILAQVYRSMRKENSAIARVVRRRFKQSGVSVLEIVQFLYAPAGACASIREKWPINRP